MLGEGGSVCLTTPCTAPVDRRSLSSLCPSPALQWRRACASVSTHPAWPSAPWTSTCARCSGGLGRPPVGARVPARLTGCQPSLPPITCSTAGARQRGAGAVGVRPRGGAAPRAAQGAARGAAPPGGAGGAGAGGRQGGRLGCRQAGGSLLLLLSCAPPTNLLPASDPLALAAVGWRRVLGRGGGRRGAGGEGGAAAGGDAASPGARAGAAHPGGRGWLAGKRDGPCMHDVVASSARWPAVCASSH